MRAGLLGRLQPYGAVVTSAALLLSACGTDSRPAENTCPPRESPSPLSPIPTLPENHDEYPSLTPLTPGARVDHYLDVPYSFPKPNIGAVLPPDESRVRAGDTDRNVPLMVRFVTPYGSWGGPDEISQERLCLDGTDVTSRSRLGGAEEAADMTYGDSLPRGHHVAEVSYVDYTGTLVIYTWEFDVD